MRVEESLSRLGSYPHVTLAWVDGDGAPVGVPLAFEVDRAAGRVLLPRPGGDALTVPTDREVSLIAGHIRPRPGIGYDERRYVELWGRVAPGGGRLVFTPGRAWGWDETEMPFFEYSERTVPQAGRYFEALSAERGRPVRPRLALGWLFLRATRLPFLSATFVPVLLGLAIAGREGAFDLFAALLTVVAAASVHLGLNVANDVFDDLLGADPANVNPTPYSGGSRVIQYGLLSRRQMALMSGFFYLLAGAIGLGLVAYTGSLELLAIGLVGVFISLFYSAPPLKLVYRGVGEVTVALGFGPVMLLGAYVVQARHLSLEALVASLPVAILVALILYVNEIPDRFGDAAAGKRTLPVRLPAGAVIRIYLASALGAFGLIVAGVVAGLLPLATLAALVAIPLALRVYRGLQTSYTSPYGLMSVMATNIRLHMVVGGLLLGGYVVAIVASLAGLRLLG